MWFIKENILSLDSFKNLNKSASDFYKQSEEELVSNKNHTFTKIDTINGIYQIGVTVQKANRVRCWVKNEDAEIESINFFGDDYIEPFKQIRKFYQDLGYENIKLHNAWLQYGDTKTEMHRHDDGAIRGAPIKQCFTSLLFCHDYWEDDWGGIFNIDAYGKIIKVSPKSNSFVTWTRDHPHWMTPIIKEDTLRMFLGTSWYEQESN